MNRTLLLILCDFLLLNLLALTRWEKAEPARAHRPPVPEMAANAQTKDRDLVAAMKESLTDEQNTRAQLTQRLTAAETNLATREQTVAELQSERTKLSTELTETQRTATELNQQVTQATKEATLTKEQLAQLQRELAERRAEAVRQKHALAALEKQQLEARQKIEGLNVAVKVAEQEKQLLRENAQTFQQQAEAERQDRQKVQATTVQLAQGVGQLAERSGELTKEIRENRPINANVLFNDFLANRVRTTFTAVRPGLFTPTTRTHETQTVFVTDGTQVYALLHLADTPFPAFDPRPPETPGTDWDKLTVEFARPPAYRSTAGENPVSFGRSSGDRAARGSGPGDCAGGQSLPDGPRSL